MRIETVGIIGAGTMGGGIAISLAQHGFQVLVHDARAEAARAAVASAAGFYARAVEKGRMTADAAAAAESRLSVADGLGEFASAELVIEAVFEDFDLKARLLEALWPLLGPEALVATNTSCLRVGDLARHVGRPGGFWACIISARRRSTRSSRWSRAKAPATAPSDGLGILRSQRQDAPAVPGQLGLRRQPVLLPLHQRRGGRPR